MPTRCRRRARTAAAYCASGRVGRSELRVNVRVQPGASRTFVGGRYGDTEPPVLIVRVTERAVDGKANQAVVAAMADAFGLNRRAVTIVSGHTSRRKVMEIDDGAPQRLMTLLATAM